MMRPLLLSAAMLVVASAADAQGGDPRLTRLDPATAAVVQGIVDSVRPLGIPSEPIVDRALQGVVRNATGPRIIAEVRTRVTHLAAARTALAPATESEIIAGADAIRSGASPETLGELRRARPSMELTVPIGVLADLIGRGVAADTAAAVIVQLASMDMRDKDLTEFRRMIDRDIALGALPTAAVALRAEAVGVNTLSATDQANAPASTRPPTAPRPIRPQRP